MDEREALREQTGRNVTGLEHEQLGEWEEAATLYELNLAEGFAGPWPYERLVALYTKHGQPAEVLRVRERAVEVLQALPRSQPERGPRLKAARQQLKEAQRALQPGKTRSRRQGGPVGARRKIPLPIKPVEREP